MCGEFFFALSEQARQTERCCVRVFSFFGAREVRGVQEWGSGVPRISSSRGEWNIMERARGVERGRELERGRPHSQARTQQAPHRHFAAEGMNMEGHTR